MLKATSSATVAAQGPLLTLHQVYKERAKYEAEVRAMDMRARSRPAQEVTWKEFLAGKPIFLADQP